MTGTLRIVAKWAVNIVVYIFLLQFLESLGYNWLVSVAVVFALVMAYSFVRYKWRYRGVKVGLIENTEWFMDKEEKP